MAELRSLLAFMDPEDRARALRRYERLFDQAGEEGEEELLRKLGSPIRQVLEVEAEYRKAQKEGRTAFEDEPAAVPPEAEIIPSQKEEVPFDLGKTVKEAADELARTAGEAAPLPEDIEEELFPIADLEEPENLFRGTLPEEAESGAAPKEQPISSEEPETEEKPHEDEEALPQDIEMTPEDAEEAPTEEEEAEEGEEPIDLPDAERDAIPTEEDEAQLGRIMDFASSVKEDRPSGLEEEDERETVYRAEKPGAGRVFAAILVTVPFIALWIIGFALSLALGAVVMGVGFALCVAGVYFGGYVINRMISFMPDMLLVAGGALGCFALALLFIWTGLWIAVGGCVGVVRLTANAYRRILNRPLPEEDEDYE